MKKELPKGWEWKKLGEVCEKPSYGYTTSAKIEGSGPKFLRTTDISNGEIDWESVPYCLELPSNEEKYRNNDGDVLVSRAGSVGTSVVIRNPPRSIFASYLIRLRPKVGIYPLYLGYFLKSNIFWTQLGGRTSGTTLPGVNATNLSKLKIPLPLLSVQRRIAEILEKADALRQKQKKVNELADQFLQSVFLEMFGDPGKNPNSWPIERIDKVCIKVTDGEHNIPPRVKTGIPLLMAKNVRDNYIDLTDLSYISKDDHEKSQKRCNVEKGDVLLVCVGATIGRVAIVPEMEEFSLVRSVALLKPNYDKITSRYLLWCLKNNYTRSQLLSRRNISAQAGLYINEIKKIKLLIPPFSLQKKFDSIVKHFETFRKNYHRKSEKLDMLFFSLLQRAFTGELTVKWEEEQKGEIEKN